MSVFDENEISFLEFRFFAYMGIHVLLISVAQVLLGESNDPSLYVLLACL